MKFKLTLAAFLVLNVSLFAQGELSKVATGTAQFLKIGIGSRGIALGDAYTALADGVHSMYWNPAGIQKIGHTAVAVSQLDLYAGIKHNFIGAVAPIDENTTIGVSLLYLSSGDIERTTIEEPEGTGSYFSTSHMAWGLTVSRRVTERFVLGVTVKYISERLDRAEASTAAFDIGSQFNTGIYGLKIGMVLANFGGKMKFDGANLNYQQENDITGISYPTGARLRTEEWPIPLLFRLGAAMDIMGKNSEIITSEKNRITLSVEGNDPVDHLLHYNFGAEYEWNSIFAIRAGYKENYDEAGFTAGIGLDFTKIGIGARLDYAYNDMGMLGKIHNYSLEFSF